MAPFDQVHAVVVDYQTPALAVEAARQLVGAVAALTIVNNGRVAWDWPAGVDTVCPSGNLGYGGAANLVARRIDARWLLLLNADARIRSDALRVLLEQAMIAEAVVSGPQLYLDDAFSMVLPPALPFDANTYAKLHARWESEEAWNRAEQDFLAQHCRLRTCAAPIRLPALSGACLLIDLDWFRDRAEPVFDPRFFLYYEDTDLCRRVHDAGSPPLLVPMARAVHYWDSSPDPDGRSKTEWMQRSEQLYREKHRINPGSSPIARDSQRFRVETVWSEATDTSGQAIDVSLDAGFSQFLTLPTDAVAAAAARLMPHRVYLRDRGAEPWRYMLANA